MRIHHHAMRMGHHALASCLAAVIAVAVAGHAHAASRRVDVAAPDAAARVVAVAPRGELAASSASSIAVRVPSADAGRPGSPSVTLAAANACGPGVVGYWSGFWTWDPARRVWFWTWVWNWCPGQGWSPS